MADEALFVSVQSRGLIAIPTSLRKRYGLDQPGAQVEIIERNGELVLRPHIPVPVQQAWFWSNEWQAKEQAAEGDARDGRVISLDQLASPRESQDS
jgi:bifunctional DNA-binding transcriptional regulator/antitoxin component of YhaV-PrlF toxin-antitoxin module